MSVISLIAAVTITPACAGSDEMWADILGSQLAAAHAAFERHPPDDLRTRALARAVLALARPDLSEGEVARVAASLQALSSGDDAIALLALYLEARLYQAHTRSPDYTRSAQMYRELAQRWPDSHWAQLGLVKLGLVMLYALPAPADAAERIAGADALLPAVTEPFLRRDLELQIGRAALAMHRPLDEVLPHLIAADRVGGLLGNVPADLVVQIGELSARAGHPEQARAYFERFLREFPSDPRGYNVRQRLQEISAPAKNGGGA